ncbi:MAG: efflux RND transporter permease subunit, partial [Desulfobacterales bacterium]
MKITEYAVSRRLAACAIAAALVVLGFYGLWRLPVDYLPDVNYPMVKIQIQWPAATPDEIDTEIADPLERLMATVDRLDHLESSSMEGLYSLDVHFEDGADIDVAFQDVLAALTRAQRQLPDDTEAPYVFKADPSQLPVMQITAASDRWGPVKLRDWADNWLQDRILAVSGVAGTEIIGGLEREIRIELDPSAMEKHGISLNRVIDRISSENTEITAGRVTEGPREIIARTMGEYADLDEIGSVVVAENGPAKVYLKDIAEVADSHEDVRVMTRFNGEECVKVSVLQEAEANTVRTAENVGRLLRRLEPELPEGLRLGYVEDQSLYVKQSLEGVKNSAIAAAVLLIIVVYLFLGSARQVAIMVTALPLTLVINFGFMKLAGFSLNTFSLGGLIVALGVVLDNSIVVVENISRMRRNEPGGEAGRQAVEATSEVGPALVAATLSFMALFVPFLIVPGLISLLFRELILVIAGIVVISLIVAVTLTPMITAALFGSAGKPGGTGRFGRMFARITEGYGVVLDRLIGWRWAVMVVFIVVLAAGIVLLGRLGGEFLPLIDDGRITVNVKMPTGASVHETNRVLEKIEAGVADDPRIESTFALAGGRVRGLITNEVANEGQVDIQLVPRAERDISTKDYVDRLRKTAAQTEPPGGRVMARQMPIKGIAGLRAADVIVRVRGQDMDVLEELAVRTRQTMEEIEGLANVSVSMDRSKPEYQIRVDREKAAELGISISEVAASLRSLISGAVPTRFKDGSEYYDIRVLVPEKHINSRQDVENLVLAGGGESGPLRLRDIAEVAKASGPVEIIRKDQIKQISVEASTEGSNVAEATRKLRGVLAQIEKPAGYEFEFGGSAEMMADMKDTVLAVLAFALFFSFIVLTVQFNSLKLPVLILLSVPVCLCGSVFVMHAAGLPLGATVVIGVLVVIAVTVNDGVLLLTYANEIMGRQEKSAGQAVITAAKIRLRPRVMTSVTTMVGFLPLALNISEGGDMLQPMAVAAIGGLGMEIMVALFLMPCMYVTASRK